MGKAIPIVPWLLKLEALLSLPQYAGLSCASRLSQQHTPALTLPAESQSVYLQPRNNTLSTTAPTAQSRKCYQRQCTSGWLCSAPLGVEQTAPYLSVCTLLSLSGLSGNNSPPVLLWGQFIMCVCLILVVYCFSSIQLWWHSCGCNQAGRTIQEKLRIFPVFFFFRDCPSGQIRKLICHKPLWVLLWDRWVNLFSMCISLQDCTEQHICWCLVYKQQHASSIQKQCITSSCWKTLAEAE